MEVNMKNTNTNTPPTGQPSTGDTYVEAGGKYPRMSASCPDEECSGVVTFKAAPSRQGWKNPETYIVGRCSACSALWHRAAIAARERALCPTCGGLLTAKKAHTPCGYGNRPCRTVVQVDGQLFTRNRWYLEQLVAHGKLEEYLAGEPSPLAEFRKEPAP
jgi:hypothetical protein